MKSRRPRLQGYYICPIPCSTEFIHPIPLRAQKCPVCGNIAERLSFMNGCDLEDYKERKLCDATGVLYEGF